MDLSILDVKIEQILAFYIFSIWLFFCSVLEINLEKRDDKS